MQNWFYGNDDFTQVIIKKGCFIGKLKNRWKLAVSR